MKLPTVETHIKLDINIAISISVIVMASIGMLQNHDTKEEVVETKKEVKNIDKNTDVKLDNVLNKTFDRLNQYGNLTALNDKQIITIVKQILREVR